MSLPIEDYAIIGDTRTAALVSRSGSIDWLCLPRFDSGACFAALLGDARHGCWRLAPVDGAARAERRYRGDTMVLETVFRTGTGAVRVVDCMPPDEDLANVIRLVEGLEGDVPMRSHLAIRWDYGWILPWLRTVDGGALAVGGQDAAVLRAPVPAEGRDGTLVTDFTVAPGQRVPFVLSWFPSHQPPPGAVDAVAEIGRAVRWWNAWTSSCSYEGPWRDEVVRSALTLKALTYEPTGGIVAAATTSLPERLGGERNWDYRYCWLRDATFTLYALMLTGFHREAGAWREWLMRAAAGDPAQLQIMYGVAGERRLPELTLPWLTGYEDSRPVRIGNGAAGQFQLDVYGEVMDALYQARKAGLAADPTAWGLQRALLETVEGLWPRPDRGIWEVRGPLRHFTHSKVMAWVAFDRAVKSVERMGLEGPVERWRATRDAIHREVCARGFDPAIGSFVQSYDSTALDANLLMLPLVGFLPAGDPRMRGTVRAIERELLRDGLVSRYRTEETADGLPPGEGAFLLCTFWLADNYALGGRLDEARGLFERLLALRNDVGLLSEQYDVAARRQLGNFPQAFSHMGLINTAHNLALLRSGPAHTRKE